MDENAAKEIQLSAENNTGTNLHFTSIFRNSETNNFAILDVEPIVYGLLFWRLNLEAVDAYQLFAKVRAIFLFIVEVESWLRFNFLFIKPKIFSRS